MNQVKEVTVDFIILYKTGNYLCRKTTKKELRDNHLYARSFDTRKEAEEQSGTVLRRVCRLEYPEKEG